jgi:ubiquinone biosynthesis protein Coq4
MVLLQHENTDNQATANQMIGVNSFIALTKNPADFTALYDIDAVLRQTPLATISLDYLKTQSGMAEIIQERYLAPVPDIDELLSYPQDSLGYVFASHLKGNGFAPVFYRQIAVQDDITYITLRRSQTHDIHHIITGFGTDLAGEIGLQAFELAQMRSPLAIALLASGIVNTLSSPDLLQQTMACIHEGWQMGSKAKPLMAQKWEQHWEKSVAQWQAELEIEPIHTA